MPTNYRLVAQILNWGLTPCPIPLAESSDCYIASIENGRLSGRPAEAEQTNNGTGQPMLALDIDGEEIE